MSKKNFNLELSLLDHSSSDSKNPENETSNRLSYSSHDSSNSAEEKELISLQDPFKSFYILFSCLLSLDFYFLLYLIPEIPFFTYCDSTFFISEVVFTNGDEIKQGRQHFKDIDCKTAFSECVEVCPVIEDLQFSIFFLLFGVSLRFLFISIEILLLVLKNYKKISTHIKVIYLSTETFALLSLILGYSLFIYFCQLSRLESKEGSSFSSKTFHYSSIIFLCFLLLSRLFTLLTFPNHENLTILTPSP